jgi:hypothetical protein
LYQAVEALGGLQYSRIARACAVAQAPSPALYDLADGTGRLPPDTEVHVTLENGKVLVTFPTPDGRFVVPRVPDGVHTLGVLAPKWVFPAVKLVTGAGVHNAVIASLPELPLVGRRKLGDCL